MDQKVFWRFKLTPPLLKLIDSGILFTEEKNRKYNGV